MSLEQTIAFRASRDGGAHRLDLGVEWILFIPIVERINADGTTLLQEGDTVTGRSVTPVEWGEFLK